jgi:phosphinothricin acetyltransferase
MPRQHFPVHIRLATETDLVAINDIYNHYVLTSTATYQEESEPMEGRRAWFAKHQSSEHPATVAINESNAIVGWGSLSPWRDRSAYRFSVENSVYVRHDLHGHGIGSALLADLIARAQSAKLKTIVAGIDAEQRPSIALHRRFGFEINGTMKQVGYKFDRWLDVVFMQLMLEGKRHEGIRHEGTK